jgi:adenylate cyclase
MKINLPAEKTEILASPDETLLSSFLRHGINHKHVCGGNARCSTCRIMVLSGFENVSPKNEREIALGIKKGFSDQIRLACQTKIHGDISARRLVLDDADAELASMGGGNSIGQEKEIAILFSDIRGFTTFAEKSLPYDVIHILNRYFLRVGDAIYKNNGYIDKYMGDGIMALFGIEGESSKKEICHSAVESALQMIDGLEELNDYLFKNFQIRFTIGIGIHYGLAILGNLGHPLKVQLTAVGDSVNLASRIEQATKETGASILVSNPIYLELKENLTPARAFEKELKGKSGFYTLHEIIGWETSKKETNSQETEILHFLEKQFISRIFGHNAAPYVRLAFHDCFDKSARGLFQFDESLEWEENANLGDAVLNVREVFEKARATLLPLSLSDIIVYTSCYAIRICGGPKIAFTAGRRDIDSCSVRPVLPAVEDSFQLLIEKYSKNGFAKQDFVALGGAHTLGRAYGREITPTPFKFDNSFFKLILERHTRQEEVSPIATDRTMLDDPEALALVKIYAEDQARFFKDFEIAYQKLISP